MIWRVGSSLLWCASRLPCRRSGELSDIGRETKEALKTNGDEDLHRRTALWAWVSARLYSWCRITCSSQINAVVEYAL